MSNKKLSMCMSVVGLSEMFNVIGESTEKDEL